MWNTHRDSLPSPDSSLPPASSLHRYVTAPLRRSGQPLAGFLVLERRSTILPSRLRSPVSRLPPVPARSPCPSLLACAVAAGLLRNPRLRASARKSMGLEHRSPFQPRASGLPPPASARLPCPSPSDAIRAPRPSFARSSMIGLPSASESFRDWRWRSSFPPPGRTHPDGDRPQVPPGMETGLWWNVATPGGFSWNVDRSTAFLQQVWR